MSASRPQPTTAPVPRAQPQVARLRRRLSALLRPFWVTPAFWTVGAVALGLTVPRLDAQTLSTTLPFLFPGDVEGARSVLSTIAGAMISVTGLVFSNTMVVLQLASSQFSPRLLQTFLQDKVVQHTLGVFTASFVYALTVLRSLADNSNEGTNAVPQAAVTLAFVFVLAAVAMFLAFIHHITRSVGVENIVRRTADSARALLDRSGERRSTLPFEPVELPHLGHQRVAVADRSGYLDGVDAVWLARTAARHDVRVEVVRTLGDFVVEGSPVALVHGATDSSVDWSRTVLRGVELSRERSMAQDMSYGFRRLVDIAERALSPGINDPTTAVQAVDQLHDLLRRLVVSGDPYPVHLDEEGVPRLVTQEATFSMLLDLAVDEVAHWGKDSLQIPVRLREMLEDLVAVATPDHVPVVRAKLDQLA